MNSSAARIVEEAPYANFALAIVDRLDGLNVSRVVFFPEH
jgi:hypothetical protein